MKASAQLAQMVGKVPACQAIGIPRASFYRWRNPPPAAVPKPRPQPARALKAPERQAVLDTLHAPRFVDKAPAEVYAALLDEGVYLCSIRGMYRLLAEEGELRERRNHLRHPQYRKPELLATGPNQVWSWDITKLLGPVKWTYYYLYVILDIFSRLVVGWMLALREAAHLAQRLITETCRKENVAENQLTIHSDRGPAMTSQLVVHLLADLGLTRSLSRPHVSNDNPFSESQFKTLKYQPTFPDRFESFDAALAFCRKFFPWYNHHHYHSGLGLLTPAMVHYGTAEAISARRQEVLARAYELHPERFVRKPPASPAIPREVWINPPKQSFRTDVFRA